MFLIYQKSHGMEANHITFGIMSNGDEAVFANGHFFLENTATILFNAGGF